MKGNDSEKLIDLIEANDIVSLSRYFEGNPNENSWFTRV